MTILSIHVMSPDSGWEDDTQSRCPFCLLRAVSRSGMGGTKNFFRSWHSCSLYMPGVHCHFWCQDAGWVQKLSDFIQIQDNDLKSWCSRETHNEASQWSAMSGTWPFQTLQSRFTFLLLLPQIFLYAQDALWPFSSPSFYANKHWTPPFSNNTIIYLESSSLSLPLLSILKLNLKEKILNKGSYQPEILNC